MFSRIQCFRKGHPHAATDPASGRYIRFVRLYPLGHSPHLFQEPRCRAGCRDPDPQNDLVLRPAAGADPARPASGTRCRRCCVSQKCCSPWRLPRSPSVATGCCSSGPSTTATCWMPAWATTSTRYSMCCWGWCFLSEKLRRLQWWAVALAFTGVAIQLIAFGSLPWIALVLASSFAIYGLNPQEAGPRCSHRPANRDHDHAAPRRHLSVGFRRQPDQPHDGETAGTSTCC